MKFVKYIIILVTIYLVGSSIAFAESISVKAGSKVRLTGWSHFDKRCRVTGYAAFRATGKLRYGKISNRKEKWKISRVSSSKLKKCIGKAMKGVRAYYVAGKKKGKDSFTLVRINKNGRQKNKYRFKVTIY